MRFRIGAVWLEASSLPVTPPLLLSFNVQRPVSNKNCVTALFVGVGTPERQTVPLAG
jgi:hypothetical protein